MGGAGTSLRRRVVWILVLTLAGCGALAARLAWIQVWRGPALFRRASAIRTRMVPVQARRGTIIDQQGEILAESVGADSVYATPAQVVNRVATSVAVARVLGLDPARVERRLSQRLATVWLARKVGTAQAVAVRRLALPGIHIVQESRRIYPMGMFAAQVLGFVGIDNQGQSGVELSYNRALSGRPGAIVTETDARNHPIPGGINRYVPPVPGDTLQLTLSVPLQRIVQRELDAAVVAAHGVSGYAMMMDPSTGGILALAAWPTFDPNQARQADPSLWTDPLISFAFSPGSVFKPITAAAALQEGVVTPQTPFMDSGSLRVPGAVIHNFNRRGLGSTTFAIGFQKSANTIFGRVGMMLGVERFYRYLTDFGFTGRSGVDLPGEARRPNILVPQARATPLDLVEESFGQTLAVTPLSVLTAISAIANGGNLMWPHIGMALRAPNGKVIQRIDPRVVRRVLKPRIASQVQELMTSVVEEGSGRQAKIACYAVAGKTGTTQKYAGGRVAQGRYIASFLGFAPAHGARIALYVMIDEPQGLYYGGQVAAPAFRAMMVDALRVLHVPPSCPPGVRPLEAAATRPPTVAMPGLVGQTPVAAEQAAVAAGLFLRVEGRGDRILRQVPPAGTAVQRWSTVLAYTTAALALPEGHVTVPDLRGLGLGEVVAELGRRGLQLEAKGSGVVVGQDPPPGGRLHPGETVRVVFGAVRGSRPAA